MSNLNKFQNSYQVLKKKFKTLSCAKKKVQVFINNVLIYFLSPKILTPNTLNINVHKCVSVTKTKCAIAI